jgi:small subunit ribosomal protein S4
MESLLRKFALQAKKLMSSTTQQAEQERKALLSKLHSLALTAENAQLDDILALQLKNILERRLQTMVVRKGFANTVKQARQFIVHRHIMVADKIVTSPSYIVSKVEEHKIAFVMKSPLASPDHPERPEQIARIKEASQKKQAAPAVAPAEPKAEQIEVKE